MSGLLSVCMFREKLIDDLYHGGRSPCTQSPAGAPLGPAPSYAYMVTLPDGELVGDRLLEGG